MVWVGGIFVHSLSGIRGKLPDYCPDDEAYMGIFLDADQEKRSRETLTEGGFQPLLSSDKKTDQ